MTELALLLPMLILLILGGLDLARIYDSYVSITNASREGARFASSRPSVSATDVRPRVLQELTGTGISSTNVTIDAPTCARAADSSSINCIDAVDGDYITIRISVPFRFVTLLIVDQSHSIMNLSNATTMPIILP